MSMFLGNDSTKAVHDQAWRYGLAYITKSIQVYIIKKLYYSLHHNKYSSLYQKKYAWQPKEFLRKLFLSLGNKSPLFTLNDTDVV